MSLIACKDPAMMNGKRKTPRFILAVLAAALMAPPLAAAQLPGETARTEKEQQKRLAKLSELDAAYFADIATIEDDGFETSAKITTARGFSFKGGFTSRVRSDNFVRAVIDKSNGRTVWQIYQTVTYTGDWRRFTQANIKIGDELVARALTVISRDVVTCSYGACVYSEVVGIRLTEDEVATLASSVPTGLLQFRLKAESGFDWDDDIAIAELAGAYSKVAEYRSRVTAE